MPDRHKASTSVSWIYYPLAITGSAAVSSSGGSDRDFVMSGDDDIEGFFATDDLAPRILVEDFSALKIWPGRLSVDDYKDVAGAASLSKSLSASSISPTKSLSHPSSYLVSKLPCTRMVCVH